MATRYSLSTKPPPRTQLCVAARLGRRLIPNRRFGLGGGCAQRSRSMHAGRFRTGADQRRGIARSFVVVGDHQGDGLPLNTILSESKCGTAAAALPGPGSYGSRPRRDGGILVRENAKDAGNGGRGLVCSRVMRPLAIALEATQPNARSGVELAAYAPGR
jgi:hypothetical protein